MQRVLTLSGAGALLLAPVLSKPILEILFSRDGYIEYPNDLYIYSTQLTLALGAAALIVVARYWSDIDSRLGALTSHGLAVRIFLLLAAVEFALVCGFLLTASGPRQGLARHFFHLGQEWNLPTYFSATQLVLASALTVSCARASASSWSRAVLLASSAILIYLATDEVLQLHERWGSEGVRLFNLLLPESKYSYAQHGAAWTFAAMCVALPVSALFVFGYWRVLESQRFLLALLALSGSLYLIAAAGLENVSALTGGTSGPVNYVMLIEEWLEMFSVSIAVYVFVRLRASMGRRGKHISSAVSTPPTILST